MIKVEILVVPGSFLLPTATTGGMSSSLTALPLFNCRSREKFKFMISTFTFINLSAGSYINSNLSSLILLTDIYSKSAFVVLICVCRCKTENWPFRKTLQPETRVENLISMAA